VDVSYCIVRMGKTPDASYRAVHVERTLDAAGIVHVEKILYASYCIVYMDSTLHAVYYIAHAEKTLEAAYSTLHIHKAQDT